MNKRENICINAYIIISAGGGLFCIFMIILQECHTNCGRDDDDDKKGMDHVFLVH